MTYANCCTPTAFECCVPATGGSGRSGRAGVWVRRRYLSRAERAALLERYADELEHELTAVRERIQDLSEEG